MMGLGCKKDQNQNQNPEPDTAWVTDIDGNKYKVVKIFDRYWMAENLKTTRYNDGTEIPFIADGDSLMDFLSPAYTVFDNGIHTVQIYGLLYNFYAVKTDKLCPVGWHMPAESKWLALIDSLGGRYVAGGPLKDTGTYYWEMPNTLATNETGFTALPGGQKPGSNVGSMGYQASFWTGTAHDSTRAMAMGLQYMSGGIYPGPAAQFLAFSVRCMRNDVGK
jgi:uncharacterized protein (TIGR02145 family)